MPPMIEGLTSDLLYKNGKRIGYITGVQAFSQMGLTTQISSKILIASYNYRRPLKRGGYDISYTLQLNEITDDNILLLRILDALKFIKTIPATTPDMVISQIKTILKTLSDNNLTMLIELSKNYQASTRALLGSILESEFGINEGLKLTLNPFTKYKIGVSSKVLPQKANWNIV
jgi:transposase